MNPASPTYLQSRGTPQTLTLANDGRVCELRNGCLVMADTREVITGSNDTAAFVLARCVLTAEQRNWWKTWGAAVCDRMSSQSSMGQAGSGLRRSNRIVEKMEAA